MAGECGLASPETNINAHVKTKTRNEGSICCTVTGSYINEDEINKSKVTRNEKSKNGTGRRTKNSRKTLVLTGLDAGVEDNYSKELRRR